MENAQSAQSSAEVYDAFWKRFKPSQHLHPANIYRYKLISDAILKYAPQAGCLVDLGCGRAALTQYLQQTTQVKKFIGLDTSPDIVEFCKKNIPGAEFHQADLQLDLPVQWKQVADVVVCSEVVEHLDQYIPLLQTASRVVKPGGIFILTTQGGKRRRHDVELLGHVRHFDINALANDVANCGFTIEKKQQCGFPILNIQKMLVSAFMNRVRKEMDSEKEASTLFKIAYRLVGIGLTLSSRSCGPQLLIVGRRNAAGPR